MSFTFSSESSGCLQIMLVITILPNMERNPYLPLLTSIPSSCFMLTSLLADFLNLRDFMFAQKGQIFILLNNVPKYCNRHSHMAYVQNNTRHLPHDGLQCGYTVAVCLVLLYHVENYNNSQNICSDISFCKNSKILHFHFTIFYQYGILKL